MYVFNEETNNYIRAYRYPWSIRNSKNENLNGYPLVNINYCSDDLMLLSYADSLVILLNINNFSVRTYLIGHIGRINDNLVIEDSKNEKLITLGNENVKEVINL